MFCSVYLFIAILFTFSSAAPPLQAGKEISQTKSNTEKIDLKSNDTVTNSPKRKQEPSIKKEGYQRFYGFDDIDKLDDTTRRKKPPCGPIKFPEDSCEELRSTPSAHVSYRAAFNLDDILDDDYSSKKVTTRKTRKVTPRPPSTTTPTSVATSPVTKATETADTKTSLLKRITKTFRSYYRNVPPRVGMYRRPPAKMYRFRQFLAGEVTETSSTRPYGWESTPTTVAKLPEACNKLAKCEDQTW